MSQILNGAAERVPTTILPPPKLKLTVKTPISTSEVSSMPGSFKKIHRINEGGSGVVSLAKHGDVFVAVKRIRGIQSEDHDSDFTIAVSDERVQAEIDIWRSMNHPNINRLLATYNIRGIYYLMSEPAEGRDLFDVLSTESNFVNKHAEFLPALHHDISAALLYLHDDLQIYHGDVKPENIILRYQPDHYRIPSVQDPKLIVYKHDLPRSQYFRMMQETDKSGKNKNNVHYYRITFQLIDFGASRSIDAWDVTRFHGTMPYMAPEFLYLPDLPCVTSDIRDERVDPRAQDVWAFAITMWNVILPNYIVVLDSEIGSALPSEYLQTFHLGETQAIMPTLWRTEKNLGTRFDEMSKIEGITYTSFLPDLIRGMTAFDVTQRFRIADVAMYNLLLDRSESGSDSSTVESDY